MDAMDQTTENIISNHSNQQYHMELSKNMATLMRKMKKTSGMVVSIFRLNPIAS